LRRLWARKGHMRRGVSGVDFWHKMQVNDRVVSFFYSLHGYLVCGGKFVVKR
jgi:hypothetical protein